MVHLIGVMGQVGHIVACHQTTDLLLDSDDCGFTKCLQTLCKVWELTIKVFLAGAGYAINGFHYQPIKLHSCARSDTAAAREEEHKHVQYVYLVEKLVWIIMLWALLQININLSSAR